MTNKKPEITRKNTVVLIDCFEEKAAIKCEKEIKRIINSRVMRMMVMRKIKR